MQRFTLKTLILTSVASLPSAALAHHGEEPGLLDQLWHALADPFHLSITLAVAAGLFIFFRRKKAEKETQ